MTEPTEVVSLAAHHAECDVSRAGICTCEVENPDTVWRDRITEGWARNTEVDYLLDIVTAVRTGHCSARCVFADHDICRCPCFGYWHGALWRKTIVGTWDDPRVAREVHA